MLPVDRNSLVDLDFQLQWRSATASHVERYHAAGVNVWRDWLPRRFLDLLAGSFPGDRIEMPISPGDGIPSPSPQDRITISAKQFGDPRRQSGEIVPRAGRFYPKGILQNVSGIFPQNCTPFRCLKVGGNGIGVDLGHPMAGKTAVLSALVGDVKPKAAEKGGSSQDWLALLTDGAGMQARSNGTATDFFSDAPYERKDVRPDGLFYESPRLVQHIDDTAIDQIRALHGAHLTQEMRVLDLMGSWQTHLPENFRPSRLTVLGMNEAELNQNPRATDILLHDLNQRPTLPFSTRSYDAVICTVSVEYLTDPVAVFREVGRVLTPGGVFMVSFSDRWFPPKVVRIWEELHDFERMGLVLEYFLSSGAFDDLATFSVRGWPRPAHDKYASQRWHSDPVYMVMGRKPLK